MRENPNRSCGHFDAVYKCQPCIEAVRSAGLFPLQANHDKTVKPGPREIPWLIADRAWAVYAQRYGTSQSVERMAQRGGFGWSEMDMFAPGWREEVDELTLIRKRDAEHTAMLEAMQKSLTVMTAERDAALARLALAESERSVAIAALGKLVKLES